jgi:16S rRNA A1518/A1519 N6-dimethyltransferase RsmA/KsgA/DIM1 with predicted DNA glycosylase/AP lyase activity
MALSCAPYVSSDPEVVKRMLEVAKVGADDLVYDLGCGDARILTAAVKDFKARGAVGYEIREDVYATALSAIEKLNLQDRIKLVYGDLFNADISNATVIALYLTTSANEKLRGKLEKEARSGTRVVSHDFKMLEWEASFREDFGTHTIYLYKIPDAFRAALKKSV